MSRAVFIAAALSGPPIIADIRPRALDWTAPPIEFDHDKVRSSARDLAGIDLGPAILNRGLESFDHQRRAVVALGNFGPPSAGTAEVVCLAEFAFSRRTLLDLSAWVVEMGITTLTARIASDDHRGQAFARRLDFKVGEPCRLDDGRSGFTGTLTFDGSLLCPLIIRQSLPSSLLVPVDHDLFATVP